MEKLLEIVFRQLTDGAQRPGGAGGPGGAGLLRELLADSGRIWGPGTLGAARSAAAGVGRWVGAAVYCPVPTASVCQWAGPPFESQIT